MTYFKKRITFNITLLIILGFFVILITNFNRISKFIIYSAYKEILDKPEYKPLKNNEINNFLKIYKDEIKKISKTANNLNSYIIKKDIKNKNITSGVRKLRGITIDAKNNFPVFSEENKKIFKNTDFFLLPIESRQINFFKLIEMFELKIYDLISLKKYDEAILLYEKSCFFITVLSNTFDYYNYIVRRGKVISANILTENFLKKDFPQQRFLNISEQFKEYHIDYKKYHSMFADIYHKHGLNIYNNHFEYYFNLYNADNKLKKSVILTPDTLYAIKDIIFHSKKNKISNILEIAMKNPNKTELYNIIPKSSLLFHPVYNFLIQYSYTKKSSQYFDITISACKYLLGKTKKPADPVNRKELKIIKGQKSVNFISSGENMEFETETNYKKTGIISDDISVSFNL